MAADERDNPKAEEAFLDFVQLGPGRSLPALAEKYRTATEPVPTRQLSRLKIWSSRYGWQSRLATARSELSEAKLAEAAELDADTFNITSRLLNERVKMTMAVDTDHVVKVRESVRKPTPKGGTVDVVHSGTVKHAHKDMSGFSDDEIDALAAIAERRKALA